MAETRGRKRKPTAVKRAAGTLQPCRENPNEPIPLDQLGPAPDWLEGDALEAWQHLADTCWWLMAPDRFICEMFCVSWALCQQALAAVLKGGMEQTTAKGYTAISGAMISYNSLSKHLLKVGGMIGLDPVSRSQISVPPRPPTDEYTRFRKD